MREAAKVQSQRFFAKFHIFKFQLTSIAYISTINIAGELFWGCFRILKQFYFRCTDRIWLYLQKLRSYFATKMSHFRKIRDSHEFSDKMCEAAEAQIFVFEILA